MAGEAAKDEAEKKAKEAAEGLQGISHKQTGNVSMVGTGKNIGGRPTNEAKAAKLLEEAKKLGWKEPAPAMVTQQPAPTPTPEKPAVIVLPPLTPAEQEACRKAGRRWWEIIEAFLPALGKEWMMKKIKDEETKAVIVDESKDFREATEQFFIDRRWSWVPGLLWLAAISVRYFVWRLNQLKDLWKKFFPEKKKKSGGGADGEPKDS